jgi:alginate O-acetyltransferase complex protein AlgI
MLFNSTIFLQFFAAFLLLYYLCRDSLVRRNVLIVAASWLFYGWWDVRFLGLLIFSGCFDFLVGRLLDKAAVPNRRRLVLAASVAVNLTLLGFFKYFNFFVDSMAVLLGTLHLHFHPRTLAIVLPAGISFYTFQSLGYVIDVYRRQLPPTRSLLQYLAFVSFFPQLIAGPIHRGQDLLPQFARSLTVTSANVFEGVWFVLFGLFKKVVIADNLAPLVEMVFDAPPSSGAATAAATVAFGFQIYGDFSGYSDIARGLGRMLGFDLARNFALPYFATSLREFWQRWHITLSRWLRDYLYISLGGNRLGRWRTSVNVLITLLLGGLWHGAAWNYVLWGGWHGVGLVANRWWQERPGRAAGMSRWFAAPLTLLFVFYGWLLFRAGSFERVCGLTRSLAVWQAPPWLPHYLLCILMFVTPWLCLELWQQKSKDELVVLRQPAWVSGFVQGLMLLGIILFWEKRAVPFIYFQF